MSAPRFYCFHLHPYDYNVHVEGLLPVSSCIVTLLSLEECSQFESATHSKDKQNIQFKQECIGHIRRRQAALTILPLDITLYKLLLGKFPHFKYVKFHTMLACMYEFSRKGYCIIEQRNIMISRYLVCITI